jgi:hypothetical protein
MGNTFNQQQYMTGLVLLLLVAVVMLFFYGRFGEIATQDNSVDLCRQHVQVSAIARVGGLQIYDVGKCPTEYIEIDETDEEKIKKKVANEMADCWYKLGEGEYELFEADTGTVQHCVICSVMDFSVNTEVDGLLEYLGENAAPAHYTIDDYAGGEPVSYADYLHGYRSDPAVQLLYEDETQDVLDTSYDYATIFMYAKKGQVSKIWTTSGGLVVGTVGGAVLLATAGIPAVGILAGGAAIGLGGAALGYELGSDDSATWESGILLYPYDAAALRELNCDVLPAEQ